MRARDAPAYRPRLLEKQSWQYTGRLPVGRNGTCAGRPQLAQITSCISREGRELAPGPSERRAERQLGQRRGSWSRPRD
jgi:hypothetical protein